MINDFTGISDEDLLSELIKRNELATAPAKSTYAAGHYRVLIGIGRDETASIVIHDEGLEFLNLKSNS